MLQISQIRQELKALDPTKDTTPAQAIQLSDYVHVFSPPTIDSTSSIVTLAHDTFLVAEHSKTPSRSDVTEAVLYRYDPRVEGGSYLQVAKAPALHCLSAVVVECGTTGASYLVMASSVSKEGGQSVPAVASPPELGCPVYAVDWTSKAPNVTLRLEINNYRRCTQLYYRIM